MLVCRSVIFSVYLDIRHLTSKIVEVSKILVLKNTTDKEKILFLIFGEWTVVKYQLCKHAGI